MHRKVFEFKLTSDWLRALSDEHQFENQSQADIFCKENVGGRLVLLKDKAYRKEFLNQRRG